MFHFVVTAGLCVSYFVLLFLFSYFFQQKAPAMPKHALRSVLLIALMSLFVYVVSLGFVDEELGNRVLHAFGGGFLSYLICLLVVRDLGMYIRPFQLFVFSFLVVTALGVANEIIEYVLQTNTSMIFAATVTDTWLDLLSNTVGIVLGAVVLTPFLYPKHNRS